MRRLALVLILSGALVSAPAAAAQDVDSTRFYFGLRMGYWRLLKSEPAPGVEASDGRQTGVVAGVNLNRYFGVELAGDHTVVDLILPGRGKAGEYGMFALIPQVRARYPLLEGRLAPYVLAGVGITENEFKDRKKAAIGVPIRASGTTLAASLGGGVEYFVANNIAVGIETRWLMSRDQEIRIGDSGGPANLDAFMAAFNLRLLVPEGPDAAALPELPRWRPYVGFRIGGAALPDERITSRVSAPPEGAAIGPLNTLFGVGAGVDLGRYFGIDLAAESYSPHLKLQGVGTVKELALYNLLPQLRVRYPVMDGRVVPYGLAGVGISYSETKDAKGSGFTLSVHGNDVSVIGGIGAGLDYFIARNIAVGLETKYIISRGHKITVSGETESADLDTVLASVGIRVYLR